MFQFIFSVFTYSRPSRAFRKVCHALFHINYLKLSGSPIISSFILVCVLRFPYGVKHPDSILFSGCLRNTSEDNDVIYGVDK